MKLSPNVTKADGRYVEVWLMCLRQNDYEPESIDPNNPSRTIDLIPEDRGPVGWFECEISDGGWCHLLGWDNVEVSSELPWEAWCLENGVAPGQPFKVRLRRPRYTTDSWGDSDVEYCNHEIVEREAWDAERVAAEWARAALDADARVELAHFEQVVAEGEPEEAWEARHMGHVTEEWTPEPGHERRSLYCHTCDEERAWPLRTILGMQTSRRR